MANHAYTTCNAPICNPPSPGPVADVCNHNGAPQGAKNAAWVTHTITRGWPQPGTSGHGEAPPAKLKSHPHDH